MYIGAGYNVFTFCIPQFDWDLGIVHAAMHPSGRRCATRRNSRNLHRLHPRHHHCRQYLMSHHSCVVCYCCHGAGVVDGDDAAAVVVAAAATDADKYQPN